MYIKTAPGRNGGKTGFWRVDDDRRLRAPSSLGLRALEDDVLLLLAPVDDALEATREESVEDEEGDTDPTENKNERTVEVRRVGIRVPDVGEVSQNPENEFDEADEDRSLGLRRQVCDDVLPLGLRLGHVEQNDHREEDANRGD